MGNKRIDQLEPQTTIADADKIPFWKDSGGVTSYIQFSNLMNKVSDSILIGNEGSSTSKAMTQKAVSDIFAAIKASANWETRALKNSFGLTTLSYQNHLLYDSNPIMSIDWSGRNMYKNDSGAVKVISWNTSELVEGNTVKYNWESGIINDSSEVNSIASESRQLVNASGVSTVFWQACALNNGGVTVVNWGTQNIYDSAGDLSLDWGSRFLVNSGGANVFNWESFTAYDNNEFLSANFNTRLLYASNENAVFDWDNTVLYGWNTVKAIDLYEQRLYDDTIIKLDWNSGLINDSSGVLSLDWENRLLKDSSNITVFDWENYNLNDSGGDTAINLVNRYLYYASGVVSIDWGGGAFKDSSGVNAVYYEARRLRNSSNADTVNWESLELTGDWIQSSTGAFKVAVGTTGQRPTPSAGQIRFNSTTSKFEGYDGTNWVDLN